MQAWSSYPTRKVLRWWTLGNIVVSSASCHPHTYRTDLIPKFRVYNLLPIKTRSSLGSPSFFAVTWPSRNTVSFQQGLLSLRSSRSVH